MAGRSVALAVVAAVVGATMGTLLRHTAAVFGIAMDYLVLVEAIFSQMIQKKCITLAVADQHGRMATTWRQVLHRNLQNR